MATSEATPILQLTGLVRSFGGNTAVNDVTASFDGGTIHGIIGPNGSGKTTLINLISRFYALDAGDIRIDGRSIVKLRSVRVAALGVVRTFQMPKSLHSMTVRENLLVACAADHRRERLTDLTAQADEALKLVGLTQLASMAAGSLSGGQTMLLQLARAMMQKPVRVLLLDEPFAGVAPSIKERMIAAIMRLRDEHRCTVLLVSHEMGTVQRICQRVTVMSAGKLVTAGTFEEVAADPRVVEAYLGKTI